MLLKGYTGTWKVCVCAHARVICFHFKGWIHTLQTILRHLLLIFTCIFDVFPHDCSYGPACSALYEQGRGGNKAL